MKTVLKTALVAFSMVFFMTSCDGEEDNLTLDQTELLQDAQSTDPADNDKGGLKGD